MSTTSDPYTIGTVVNGDELTLSGDITNSDGDQVINASLDLTSSSSQIRVSQDTLTLAGDVTAASIVQKTGDGVLIVTNSDVGNRWSVDSGQLRGATGQTFANDRISTRSGAEIFFPDSPGTVNIKAVSGGGSFNIAGSGSFVVGDSHIAIVNDSSINTMTFNRSVKLAGDFFCNIDQAESDRIQARRNLDISEAELWASPLSNSFGSWVIATYRSLTGEFAFIPEGFEVTYGNGQIVLTRTVNALLVDDSATGEESGLIWRNAYSSLREAINEANSLLAIADTTFSGEIWVAEGIYHANDNNPSSLNANQSFRINPGIQLFGGFEGNESAFTERDPLTNITVLSGDLGRDVRCWDSDLRGPDPRRNRRDRRG